jgi:TolB-like protein/DNA-binding winged helix-turn-helix (wHTH) protein/Flp pilus assembly protein TadD
MSTRPQHLYEFGPYRLDTAERLLLRDGEPVPLTPKAFETLVALVERSSHLVEKDELMMVVWSDTFVEESNLTNNIYALRKLLGQGENGRSYIETVPKRGYRFTAPVKELQSETLVVEKRILTRVVTEEQETPVAADSAAVPIMGTGEALTIKPPYASELLTKTRKLAPTERASWPWLQIALLSVSLGIAGFFIYRSLTAAPRGQIESIAVLPFKNESGNPDIEYLSDGVAESLINRLSQLPSVKVISRSSSFQYKGKETNPAAVATALGVEAVLTGRVLQRDDSLQISVELINARDRTQIWGEQYHRKTADVLAVQQEISREIAERLRLKLTVAEQQRFARRETINPQAYELLLKGRFYWNKGGTEERKKAIEYYQEAIVADAMYALAYTELAKAYSTFGYRGITDPKEVMPKAKAAATRALDIDETLAEAHAWLAYIKQCDWDWTGAKQEFRRAQELNPNYAEAHGLYAAYLSQMQQHEQAIAEAKRARELDPMSPSVNISFFYTLWSARQYDQAGQIAKQMLELDLNVPLAHLLFGYTYAAKGQYQEAINAYKEAMKLGIDNAAVRIRLGYAYAMAG